jgi:glycosyltransferase involved in cell wall biosynthesis
MNTRLNQAPKKLVAGKRVLIVIPAFNEEAVIANVIDRIRKIQFVDYDAYICVVNDGSIDSTLEVARKHADIIINLPINLGVGSAVRAGYQYALLNHFEFVIQIDADDQHNPEYILKMLSELTEYDHVVGSRYLHKNGYEISIIVRVAQIIITVLMRLVHRIKISDPTSGFRASGKNAIALLAHSYPTTFLQDTIGSLILVKKAKLSTIEVNTPMKPRMVGESSQKTLRRIRLYLQSVLLILFWR